MFNQTIENLFKLIGKQLLTSIFVPAGIQKISAYAGTGRFLHSFFTTSPRSKCK